MPKKKVYTIKPYKEQRYMVEGKSFSSKKDAEDYVKHLKACALYTDAIAFFEESIRRTPEYEKEMNDYIKNQQSDGWTDEEIMSQDMVKERDEDVIYNIVDDHMGTDPHAMVDSLEMMIKLIGRQNALEIIRILS